MATLTQLKKLEQSLSDFNKKYLRNKNQDIDESSTRLIINHFLTQVLGYTEIEDIKTEYAIKGAYADYVIQLNRKKHFVLEAKSMSIDLNQNHLRQSIGYALDEGIDYAILSNGRSIQVFKVIFTKPVSSRLMFEVNLADLKDIKSKLECIWLLSKTSIQRREIDEYYKKVEALTVESIKKVLYSESIIKVIRKEVKLKKKVNITQQEITEALNRITS